MSKANRVLAILCSDIHLSSRPPIARSTEPDWFQAMERQLSQLRHLSEQHRAPVVCAGDIFDKWNSSPELINFALQHLPEDMYAVPGQHDLPNHNMEEIHRSAYWTLVQAGRVQHIDGKYGLDDLILYGFGWEQELTRVDKVDQKDTRHKLAVVHRYCWHHKDSCYEGAPQQNHSTPTLKVLRDYNAVVFGDNHKSWYWNDQFFGVMNCGSFFRRRIDEMSHRPVVGLLHRNGITPHYLKCHEDKFINVDEGLGLLEKGMDLTELVMDLKDLGDGALDFVEAVKRYFAKNGVPKSIRRIITQAMEGV